MGEIFLAIWIFLSSLFGANHLATSPTATPNPILAFSEMPDEFKAFMKKQREERQHVATAEL